MINREDRIKKYIELTKNYRNLLDLGHNLEDMGYFDQPASTKYHGAYEGGLFDHSFMVAKSLLELTEKLGLEWERPESPLIVGLFHDLCKCDSYIWDKENNKYIYNPNIFIPGHGDASVIKLQLILDLTIEELTCIRWHMGSYETDTRLWGYYDRTIREYPNVLYTHMADMIASKIKGV